MALMSARFYGDPTRELRVVGGHRHQRQDDDRPPARRDPRAPPACGRRLLGTVVNRIAGVERAARLTTAESLELQRMFREMVDGGDLSCVMEASLARPGARPHHRHRLRVGRLHQPLARPPRLSPDLDDYFAAKRSLFLPDERRRPGATAVVNAGDEYGRRLIDDCRAAYGDDLWTYAPSTRRRRLGAPGGAVDCAARRPRPARRRARPSRSSSPRLGLRERAADLRLPARFNVANALAAATAALAMGLPLAAVREGLSSAGGVPGRFEPVRAGQPFSVLVDYSHTPDSLANVLRAVRAPSPAAACSPSSAAAATATAASGR